MFPDIDYLKDKDDEGPSDESEDAAADKAATPPEAGGLDLPASTEVYQEEL